MKKRRRRYTIEQIEEAVRLVRVSGQPASKVARDLGIPKSTLHTWLEQALIDAGEGPPGAATSDEKEELRLLRRENAQLRKERDFLKKATAFFAKDSSGDIS